MLGTVKWFNAKKGFGFITGEDRKDYFVHHSNILIEGYRNLPQGKQVEFSTAISIKGELAIQVVPK